MAQIDQKLIDRINQLSRKQKTIGLTDEEKNEQKELRVKYLALFREGFEQEITHIKVVDSEGNDVTPEAVKNREKNGKN